MAFLILFGSAQTTFGQHTENSVKGNKFAIESKILNEKRTCLISLPDSYHDASKINEKYPVIILLDGDVFFKTAVGIVHFMSSDRNRNHLMPESIIVAIENVDRERDFTVTKIKTKRPNTMGGGKRFLDFIQRELLPFLDKSYRTQQSRTLIGHSLGGLLTLNAYMDKSSLFNSYISIDPSVWWNEEMIESKVNAVSSEIADKKLYIATANQGEANYERNKKRHDLLYASLKKKLETERHIKSAYFDKEDHRSVALIALYEGLKYLNQNNPRQDVND